MITLAATLGCLLITEKAAEVLLDPGREGRIALPKDEESSRPEDVEVMGEKAAYIRADASVPLISA